MSDIIKGIGNLFASILQVIQGAVTTVVNTIVTAFQTVFDVIVGTLKSAFNLTEGVISLILGNFLLILTAVVAYWGYITYQKRQGNNPQPINTAAAKIKAATK